MNNPSRLAKALQKKAFIPFIMAGDPDLATTLGLLKALPAAGADIIELGVPFSDPTADGKEIQTAGIRALKSGTTLKKILALVAAFRLENTHTPIVLMGYYNPVYAYGIQVFCDDAVKAGVDGVILVDLPPEEEAEFAIPATTAGLDLVRLISPTTNDARIKMITTAATGFVYYVSLKGVTGAAALATETVQTAVNHIKTFSSLPVGVGFGIKTPEQAKTVAAFADAVIVGSAIVQKIAENLDSTGKPLPRLHSTVVSFLTGMAAAVHTNEAL
jgi:tryptophan synthase alpha chain